MKKVIVFLSTYNGAKYLRHTLDCIFAQTYPTFDFIIRDDGSKDDTVEILKEYREKAPEGKKLIIFNEQTGDWSNKGAHQSYHTIIENLPEADVYLSLDQDDAWAPTKVERVVEGISKYPKEVPVLSLHSYYLCDGDLNILETIHNQRSYTPEEMKDIDLCKVIMKGTWASVGMAQSWNHALRQLTYHTGEFERSIALDCWVGWVVAGVGGAIEYCDEPLVYYRRHEGTYSSGNQDGLKRLADWKRHMNRHCANIRNGIHFYRKLYREFVSDKNKKFLDLFDSRRRFAKAFYPHRMREKLFEDLAFRVLILCGKF